MATKLSIIEQVCHALAYAHRHDVIHRDVKPANVILQPDGVVKLLDFGIACEEKRDRGLTQTGSVIGTIHYMAPERLQCREFDGRSDIFSTGVMLYQLLSGHLPFGGEDYAAIQKVLNEPYPSSDYLPKPLTRAIWTPSCCDLGQGAGRSLCHRGRDGVRDFNLTEQLKKESGC